MRSFVRHTKNLKYHNGIVFSYDTPVARIVDKRYLVYYPKYVKYSHTTSEHVNYAAGQLGLELVLDIKKLKSSKIKAILK